MLIYSRGVRGETIIHGDIPAKVARTGNRENLADADYAWILLVEHRDEVFARLAADMVEEGFRVIRATTAHEAVKHYAKHPFTLVVANLDLPDHSGWLLAAKLHLVDPTGAIWLYEPAWSNMHAAMAKFLRVDELFAYGGDLLGLADAVAARLTERSEGQAASCSPSRGSGHRPVPRRGTRAALVRAVDARNPLEMASVAFLFSSQRQCKEVQACWYSVAKRAIKLSLEMIFGLSSSGWRADESSSVSTHRRR